MRINRGLFSGNHPILTSLCPRHPKDGGCTRHEFSLTNTEPTNSPSRFIKSAAGIKRKSIQKEVEMVNISLRDSETHFDQRPSHRPVSRAVRDALAHAQDCVRDYNDRLNEIINNGIPGIDWTEITLLADQANEAEKLLREARCAELNPTIRSQNHHFIEPPPGPGIMVSLIPDQECTCKPDSDACPACKEVIRQKYGDDIPFGGE